MPDLLTNPTFIEQLAQKLRAIGSLKAVGDTWVSFDSSVPPGGVPFCGQEVTRALYADLWAWAQAQGKVKTELEWQEHAMANGGNCPYYSSGNGSTTFRMPCVLGYMKGSSVTTEGGTYKPQKIPNLKGEYSARQAMGSVISESRTEGVFEKGEQLNSNAQIASATGNASSVLLFNAHNYDDRYQDGADVQPETYQVLVGVYAVGVIQNINNTDVSQLQTGLATLEANVVKSVNGVTPIAGNVTISAAPDIWKSEDGTKWYVLFSNGFVIQGGRADGNGTVTITYPLEFDSVDHTFVRAPHNGASTTDNWMTDATSNKTTTGVTSSLIGSSNRMPAHQSWLACGFVKSMPTN